MLPGATLSPCNLLTPHPIPPPLLIGGRRRAGEGIGGFAEGQDGGFKLGQEGQGDRDAPAGSAEDSIPAMKAGAEVNADSTPLVEHSAKDALGRRLLKGMDNAGSGLASYPLWRGLGRLWGAGAVRLGAEVG